MGASSAEIEQQITETRQHLDANLRVLERRAASGVRRVARAAAIVGVGIASAALVGFVAYRLTRQRSRASAVMDAMPRSFRRLFRRVAHAFEHRPRMINVANAEVSRGPSTWWTIAEKVGTAVAVSAAGALVTRILKPRGESQK